MPRIVFIADTHLKHDFVIPDGDILVHAGDLTGGGTIHNNEVDQALQWLAGLPHAHKCFIAGNHDFFFETHPQLVKEIIPESVHYLQDSGCEIEGLKFWGAPWTPAFCDWAFNLYEPEELAEKWALIPEDTDILITHGPPFKILDKTLDHYDRLGQHVGCQELLKRVREVKPKIHCFGHIHVHGACMETIGGTTFINAAVCNETYKPFNGPIALFVDV